METKLNSMNDAFQFAESFAQLFKECNISEFNSIDIRSSHSKTMLLTNAEDIILKIDDKEKKVLFKAYIAKLCSLPWNVDIKKVGTEEEEHTASYYMVVLNFVLSCMY